MFYEITDGLRVVPFDQISEHNITVGVVSVEEFEQVFVSTNFSDTTLEQCRKEYSSTRNSIDRYDDYYFGMLNILDYDNMFEERNRIGFYLKKNLLILVKIVERGNIIDSIIEDTIGRFSPENLNFEKLIYAFFDRVMNKEKNKAEYFEKSIETLEDRISRDDTSKDVANKMATTKKILTTIKKYYDQLADVGEILLENELSVFDHKKHSSIELFAAKAHRQSANIVQLIDNLNQVKDSYQALLDHSINQTMKIFTIISAIFMPLTLMVGWYGMNFAAMPELSWDYGYIVFVLIAFVIVTGLFIFFKKRKYF